MVQTRLYLRIERAQSKAAFRALEGEFEEDGLPLAMVDAVGPAGFRELSVYVEDDPDEAQRRISSALAYPNLEISREALPDVDWVAKSLEGLVPVRAGRFVVHGAHDRGRKRAGELAIEIEAGLAFGTGHHGTTSGCLEMLSRILPRERPRNALDLGTGSAVLAIAVARLALIPVLATDIDPVAVRVAAANARLNGVGHAIEAAAASGFHHGLFCTRGPFELIVANILARPLMRLAPAMAGHIAPGGSIVLSGILERQRRAVLAAYTAQRFRHIRTILREGWATIHLKR